MLFIQQTLHIITTDFIICLCTILIKSQYVRLIYQENNMCNLGNTDIYIIIVILLPDKLYNAENRPYFPGTAYNH